MKILNINGFNLASLKGEFSIDLNNGLLTRSNIFAIIGNTGAGKSTILDALTLSLYGRTSRLSNDDLINQCDYFANIISYGETECYASVSFQVDEIFYVAKWSYSQDNTLEHILLKKNNEQLICLSSNAIETQDLIKKIIGFDWNKFIHIVVQPQNCFNSFIDATENERAKILEQVTDSGIYSNISINVFNRCQNYLKILEEYKEKLNSFESITSSEIDSYRLELSNLKETSLEISNIIETIDDLTLLKKIYQDDLQKLEEAKNNYQLHCSEFELLSPEKSILDQYDELRPAIELVNTNNCLEHKLSNKYQDKLSREKMVGTCKNIVETLLCRKDEAELNAKNFEVLVAKFNLDIENVKKIDDEIDSIQKEIDSHNVILKQKSNEKDNLQKSLLTKEIEQQKIIELLEKKKELSNKILKNINFSSQFNEYVKLMEDIVKKSNLISEENNNLSYVIKQINELTVSNNELADLVSQETEEIKPLLVKLEQLNNEITRYHDNNIKGQMERINKSLFLFGSLKIEIKNTLGLINEYILEKDNHTDLLKLFDNCLFDIEKVEKQIEQEEIILDDLKIMVHKAEANSELIKFKDLVVDDSPCPLCGSKHHELDNCEVNIKQIKFYEQMLFQLEEKENLLSLKKNNLQNIKVEKEILLSKINQSESEQKNIIEELSKRCEFWNERVVKIEPTLCWQIEELTSLERINYLIKSIDSLIFKSNQELEFLTNELNSEQKLITEFENLSDKKNIVEKSILEKQIIVTSNIKNIESLNTNQNLHKAKLNSLSQEIKDIRDRLDNSFGSSWRDIVNDDSIMLGTAFSNIANWQNQCVEYIKLKTEIDDFDSDVKNLNIEIEKINEDLELVRKGINETTIHLKSKTEKLLEKKYQRTNILSGKDLSLVNKNLEYDKNRINIEIEDIQESLQTAKTLLDTNIEQLSLITEEINQLNSEKASNELKLSDFAQNHNMSISMVKAILNTSITEINAIREKIDESIKVCDISKVILTQQEKNTELSHNKYLTLLQKFDENLIDNEELSTEWIVKKNNEKLSVDASILDIERKIKTYFEQKESKLEIESKYKELLENFEIASKLNKVIGSDDGSKLRNKIQTFTLKKLIYHTNLILEMISKRYSVLIKEESLDFFIIDHLFGEKVRTPNSLSGGEKFVLSLAFSLGLAELTKTSQFIENIFLDEGFGTLDENNLYMVFNALDSLQDANRKIGIITHEQLLIDRIENKILVEQLGAGFSRIVTL